MRQLTEEDLDRAIRGKIPDPDRDTLAVHTTIDGDVETIEVTSDFAALGPAEVPAQPTLLQKVLRWIAR